MNSDMQLEDLTSLNNKIRRFNDGEMGKLLQESGAASAAKSANTPERRSFAGRVKEAADNHRQRDTATDSRSKQPTKDQMVTKDPELRRSGGADRSGYGYSEHVRWKAALDSWGPYSKTKGVRIPKGQRHNELVRWAGELSEEVLRLKLDKEKAEAILDTLADDCCDHFGQESTASGRAEAIELKKLKKYIVETAEKNKAKIVKELDEAVSVGGAVSISGGVGSRGSSGSGVVRGKPAEKVHGKDRFLSVNRQDRVRSYAMRDSIRTAEMLNATEFEAAQQAYIQSAELFCTPDDTWPEFVRRYFLAMDTFKNGGGDDWNDLVTLIEERLCQLNMVQDGELLLAGQVRALWGEQVHAHVGVNREMYSLFLGSVINKLAAMISGPNATDEIKDILAGGNGDGSGDVPEDRKLSASAREIRGRLERLMERCKDECATGTGENEEVDVKAVKKLFRRKREEMFNCQLKEQRKKILTDKLTCALAHNTRNTNNGTRVVFQNGVYDVRRGKWQSNEAAAERGELPTHRRFMNVLYVQFDAAAAVEIKEEVFEGKLNGESELSEQEKIAGILEWLRRDGNCPRTGRFIEDMFPGDDAAQACLLLMLGYCMLQQNNLSKIFFLFGETATGKSTFTKLMRHLIGSSNCYIDRYCHLDAEHGVAAHWVGKNIVVLDEAETAKKANHQAAFTLFKAITSGDKVLTRKIYKDPKLVSINATPIILSNLPIDYEDAGGAVSRRMVSFYLDHTVPAEKRDTLLPARILLEERDKLATAAAVWLRAHWHLGEKMFLDVGGSSRACLEASEQLQESFNPLSAILQQCITVTDKPDDYLPFAVIKAVLSIVQEKHEYTTKYITAHIEAIFRAGKMRSKFGMVYRGLILNRSGIADLASLDIYEELKRVALYNSHLLPALKVMKMYQKYW